MNTAVLTRVLTIAAGIFLAAALVAFAGTVATGSVRWFGAGAFGYSVAFSIFLWRVTARYAGLIAYWQSDVHRAALPPDVDDPVVAPRQSPEEAPTNDERARRG